MRSKSIFSKIVPWGIVLALTYNMFPMQSLRAEELKEDTKQEEAEESGDSEEIEAKEKGDENLEEEASEQEIIEINTVDDFLTFADNCSLDSWSANKKFILNTDIDLEGVVFDAIPVFTGVFDGQDHTISGFRYSGDGYVAGLFRYIEKDGVVENLKLKGEIIASDEKECIGSLCGVNYGTIRKCSFQGSVSGKTAVGGLAGVNEGTGTIRNCTVGGRVTGYYSTGGFVGKNHGLLSYCVNRACINNDSEWVEEDDEMGMGLFLSINISGSGTELFSGVDTGGIAGHSDGMITGCANYGKVGYEHTGYNIGGIAGRQSGVVSLCTNTGEIYGRKDVGGIVGQMEPYIEIDEAASLRNAVNKLHDLIEKTIDDMGEGKNVIKGDLDNLTVYSDGAADAGDALAGQIADFADANLDQAQSMADRLGHVMDMLPAVFDDVFAAEDEFSDASKALSLMVDDLKDIGNIAGEYVETDYNRLTLLSTVGGNILSIQHYPEAGETVHIMAEPDSGYGLSGFRVIDADGNSINTEKKGDNDYTFVMPESNVKVEAYFSYQGGTDDGDEEDAADKSDAGKDDADVKAEDGKGSGTSDGKEDDRTDVSGEETPGGETSKDETSKDETSKDETSKDETSKDETSKDEVSSDAGNKTDSVTDENGNGAGSVSGAPGENTDGNQMGGTADKNESTSGGNVADGTGSTSGGSAASGTGSASGENAADGTGSPSEGNDADGAGSEPGSDTANSDTANGAGSASGEDAAGATGNGADSAAESGSGEALEDSKDNETNPATNSEGNAADSGQARANWSEYMPRQLMSAGVKGYTEITTLVSAAETRKQDKTVIQLSSNLSGNASYEIDGSAAVLTVVPDGPYTVDGTPSVTSDSGAVAVTRLGEDGFTYRFDISGGGTYRVNIVFKKLDKSQAVSGAKGDISSAIQEQQAAADKVNAVIKEIQSSSSVSQEQLDELAKALEEMSDATSVVLSNLSMMSNIAGQHAAGKLEDMGDDMKSAMNHLQSAVDSIKSATRDARSIVDYVNGQPSLHFSKLGGEFDVNRENLHDQLKGMSDSIKSLSGNASDYSDIVNEDLRAVNNQINIIFNLLADNLTNYGGISVEELYEEMDIADTEDITEGKTDNCRNKGIVKGDINVGGIAGAMSIDEEDPEDNAAGSLDYQIGRRYFTKCIVTGSVNEGYVIAKKDGAGGIVGYMRHGIVVDSEGYGSVESTEGDYVGGICGESLTVIKRCYALCSVSGGKNVGGIAGFADTLKDCYAMTECNAARGRKGAIAGQTVNYDDALNEEEVKVSGNYYVGDDIYGIDNISYIGVAEPISYEELLTVVNLPTEFRNLKVIFRVDDLYLGTQEIGFGEKLSNLDYPEIPEKEGYYGVWPDYSDKVMTGNLLVKGEYKEDVTVVQSKEKQELEAAGGWEKPYALVEQRFTENTVLNADISQMQPPENALNKENVIYDISLENAGIKDADTFAIRLYNPYKDAVVWGYRNGIWEELESKARGRYMQVYMTGPEQSFCVIEHKSRMWIAAVGAAGGVLLIILLAVWMKKAKARYRAKKGTKMK